MYIFNKKLIKNINQPQSGFTVLELMIATTVFSVMLLLTTTGMIQIGKVYYKGLITAKTQDTVRSISDDLVHSVQFGGQALLQQSPAVNIGGFQTYAVCMNNIRYTYTINARLASQNSTAPSLTIKHVLWFDVIKQGSPCRPVDLTQNDPGRNGANGGTDGSAGANDTDLSTDAAAQRRELLVTNMRLTQFSLLGAGDIINIQLKVIYGQDDVITPLGTCISTKTGGQFCAFSSLNTFAKRRL
jgi:prepilin-type N-terminal cleavage/methylation domain-containing protein